MKISIPPIERFRVELRLTRPADLPNEHGGVLRGLVSRSLGRHRLPAGLVPFACESGKVRFEAGDAYSLELTLIGDCRGLGFEVAAGLARLGGAKFGGPAPLLGGNFAVERVESLPAPDFEATALNGAEALELRLLAPLRLKRPDELRSRGAGFLDSRCFPADFFLDRLWRRLFLLGHGRYPDATERESQRPPLPDGATAEVGRLRWSDMPVRGTRTKGRPYTLGGVRGAVTLAGVDETWSRMLAAGAHLHVGSATAYGFGRYAVAPVGAGEVSSAHPR